MENEPKSQRARERLKLALPVRVRCKETLDFEWVEMSRLIDVTPFGARFRLAHLTEPGRLLHLTMPMPRQLRCFDHIEDQYRLYALVRNLSQYQPPPPDAMRYEIGVAFVGKRAPASYETDPTTRYEINTMSEGGAIWDVREKPAPVNTSQAARTQETRLQMPVDVIIEVFDEAGKVTEREQTVTENISRRGVGSRPWTLCADDQLAESTFGDCRRPRTPRRFRRRYAPAP